MTFKIVMVHDHIVNLVVLVIVVGSFITRLEASVLQNDECSRVSKCGATEIRFPFHLKDTEDCVFPTEPEFNLSCADYASMVEFTSAGFAPLVEFKYQVNTSLPGLYLNFSVQAYVASIDYKSRKLLFIVSSQDIRQQHDNYLLSESPFKPLALNDTASTAALFDQYDIDSSSYYNDYTFYNCSSTTEITRHEGDYARGNMIKQVSSLSGHGYQVYAIWSQLETVEAHITSCTKMYNFSGVPYNVGSLTWSEPNCDDCEAKGQYCKFKPNNKNLTHCYPKPKGPSSQYLFLAGKIGGIVFVFLTVVALYYATKLYIQKKRYQSKIETFLEDYKALKPSRYSYADIKKISNQFKMKLGEGGYGSVFKGQLSNDVVVAVKVLNDVKGSGEDFINEVSTIGLVHHVNVVRLVGYCADGCRRALVYEFLPNDSLKNFVYRENQNKGFLGWEKMQDIALGIAKGIEYLHQGCAQQILHFDIKPHNILLDENFTPKVSDFGLAKLCTKGQSMVSMTMARGTIGYIAPEVFSRNFGKVSSKSDVYSYGMLLLEMVGARDHRSVETENASEAYFPEWVFHKLERGETRCQIEEGENSNIAKKLTIVGLWCINWHPADRPSMKHVIQMLQEEDCPSIPPNPFNSASSRSASTFSNRLEDNSDLE